MNVSTGLKASALESDFENREVSDDPRSQTLMLEHLAHSSYGGLRMKVYLVAVVSGTSQKPKLGTGMIPQGSG